MAVNFNDDIMQIFIDDYDVAIRLINKDDTIIYMNKRMIKLFGNLLGEKADVIYINTNEKKNEKQVYFGEALYDITSYSVPVEDGEMYTVEIFRDITEAKKIEAKLKNSYNNLLKETEFARNIQQSVLPIDDEYWDMIDLKAEYLPADDLGGDMYDVIKLSDDEILIYIADVSGHGIRAALLTIFLREVIKGMTEIARNEGLDHLIYALQKAYVDLNIDAEMYFSIVMCKYNKSTQELSIVNAGHNCFPLIMRKKGRIEEIPLRGMPITAFGIPNSYTEETVGIYPGDRIALYTDGIIEEYSETQGTEFGVQGFRNVISSNFELNSKELCKKIIIEAGRHSKSRAKDDRSLMIITIL